MFVNVMNQEEKENFLELVYRMATCDGVYAEEEKELVTNYKLELNLKDIPDTKTVSELLNYFSEKSSALRKIVFFELYGMIMADGEIEKNEKEIMSELKTKFALDEKAYADMIMAADMLKDAYDRVYSAVFE